MKISENWLREWVNPQISTEELNEQLTMLGLEVDDVMPASGEFTQIVVGEIESIEKHPDADKLNVCQVNAGLEDKLQIVCGAPNARAGLKAPLALIGAVLPGNFKIKKSKLRGVESHGMLCSSVELGLSDDHSGLLELPEDAPVGKDIREYLKLNDTIIDVDLTPNRADCFCIKGIANDIACANELTLNYPEINEVPATHDEVIEVDLIAEKECPRYLCRVINGIDNTKTTPMWMQEKLRRSGIRSIHPVVDVTNYVMLELGQPMHGFDKAQINGSIIVKMANKGEKVTLLDGKEITLDDSYLMIADEKRHLAIAGVMGGLDSGVSENTTDIVLESAYFNPATIMGKSRDIGIHTESALRFERGVDPYLQQQAMQRATELIKQICGGEAGPIQEANSQQYIPQKDKIKLSKTKLRNILGFEVENDKVTKILQGLSMQVEFDSENWTVIPPSNRFDIEIAEDLVEEIVRMVGYDNMPSVDLITENNILLLPEEKITKNRVRTQLNQLGYQEAITYSFISEKQLQNYGFAENSIPLKNPLTEEFAIMRTSLLPGIMETANYNLRRQNSNVKLFETGNVFHTDKQSNVIENDMLVAVNIGNRYTENWGFDTKSNVDFFDIKADLENILDNTKSEYAFTKSEHSFLHPGRQANVIIDNKNIGWVGQIHPEICRLIGIKKEVYAFEIKVNDILNTRLPSYKDISKFPSVRRDIALVAGNDISYQQIKDIILDELGDELVKTFVFDEYKGENIDSTSRSLAIGLILQKENATFEDKEVDKLMAKMLSSISTKLNIEIRGN